MLYFGVGNAGPDTDGQNRGGDNLYTCSVLALDLKTGAYKWHYQEIHHDIWDQDSASAPALADITYRGVGHARFSCTRPRPGTSIFLTGRTASP